MFRLGWFSLALLAPISLLFACSDRFGVGDCNAEGTCVGAAGGADNVGDDSADSGASGVDGDDGRGAVACNGDVADDPDCWTNNEQGVFVSNQTGNDETGDGTMEAPYESINKALDRAAGKKVFVCLGATASVYEEEVVIDASRDGAAIYGGFECEGWTYRASRKPSLASTTSVGLRIADLKQGVHIENFRIAAQDAQGAGLAASSYGVFITGSQGVELTNVEVKAGRGADGADGAAGAVGKSGDDFGSAPIGTDAICFSPDAPPIVSGGAWSKASTCGSMGGAGGTGRSRPVKAQPRGAGGEDGAPILHLLGMSTGNGGAGESPSNQSLDGNPGASGENGSTGDQAAELGDFTEGGFVAADGIRGTDGYPGQGGGGGGASEGTATCYGASGGAGGMGGCGGVAGGGGGGGGASVGVFVWDAQVTLDQCKIIADAGGRGGAGGDGGLAGIGASGGAGGLPVSSFLPGGRGGPGGNGGLGGSGSGGTGGPSIALVWFGEKPLHDAASTTLVAGSGGNGGDGGTRGTAAAPDGSKGASLAELLVP